MIQIHPTISYEVTCVHCNIDLVHNTIHWQGVHTCTDSKCPKCHKEFLVDLPINQASIMYRILDKQTRTLFNENKTVVDINDATWFNSKLTTITNPLEKDIEVIIEKRKKYDKIVVLNTLDYVYGHALLELLNLQRLINRNKDSDTGIVVIVQPMMKWLLPTEGIAEVWIVKLTFKDVNLYYSSVSKKINANLERFKHCYLSNGYVLPTNENIIIEKFTGLNPYSFEAKPTKPRITFIWREDPGRLWIRNIYILKGFQKLGLSKILKPFQYVRLRLFFYLLNKKLGNSNFQLSIAGMGYYGTFPAYIDDKRVTGFSEKEEIDTCKVYAESELVIGVHGSSMLLPSAHAGMTVCMMPSKRWGNFAEDLLYSETDVRLASFQKRIIPLNVSIFETIDIALDMIKGRPYFIKKFVHSNDKL